MNSRQKVARAILVCGDQVLLLVRVDHDKNRPGDFDLPGGGIEPTDNSIAHGMSREIAEETGQVFTPDELSEIYVQNFDQSITKFERHVFWGKTTVAEIQLELNEHKSYRWVSFSEAIQLFPHPFYGKALRQLQEEFGLN